jgi:hypothetical protein
MSLLFLEMYAGMLPFSWKSLDAIKSQTSVDTVPRSYFVVEITGTGFELKYFSRTQ